MTSIKVRSVEFLLNGLSPCSMQRIEKYFRDSGRVIKVSLHMDSGGLCIARCISRSNYSFIYFMSNITSIVDLFRFHIQSEAEDYWEQSLVLVGTGYRIHFDGVYLIIDLGFSHSLIHKRSPGVCVDILKNNCGIRLYGYGFCSRLRVMSDISQLERLRKRSVYTGCGRMRPGSYPKLKPTKSLLK